jgi:hypothetical protein
MNTNALAVVRSLEVKVEVHHDACESKTYHTFLEHYRGVYLRGFHIPCLETIRNELKQFNAANSSASLQRAIDTIQNAPAAKRYARGETPSIQHIDELAVFREQPVGRGLKSPIYMLDVAAFQPSPASIREQQEAQIEEERDTGNQMLAALAQISEGVTTISGLLNSGKLTRELFTRADAKTLIDAFCAGAIQTAEAMDLVVTIENEATQPFAMGSYMPVVHVRDSNPFYRREMAAQREKEAKNPHNVTKEQVGIHAQLIDIPVEISFDAGDISFDAKRTAFHHPTQDAQPTMLGFDPGVSTSHAVIADVELRSDGSMKFLNIRPDTRKTDDANQSPVVLGHPLPGSLDVLACVVAPRTPSYHGRPLPEVSRDLRDFGSYDTIVGKSREPMAMFHDAGYQHPYAAKTVGTLIVDTTAAQQELDAKNALAAWPAKVDQNLGVSIPIGLNQDGSIEYHPV